MPLHWQLVDELIRREISQAGMRSDNIVLAPPSLDDHLRFGSASEPFEIQTLVSELPIETLIQSVLPGLTWIDQSSVDLVSREPSQNGS